MYLKNKMKYWVFTFFTIIYTINSHLYNKSLDKAKHRNILKRFINNHKYNKKINSFRYLDDTLIKCKSTDEICLKNKLCIECNFKNGYYPIIYNYHKNTNSENYFKYKNCYSKDVFQIIIIIIQIKKYMKNVIILVKLVLVMAIKKIIIVYLVNLIILVCLNLIEQKIV